MHTWQRLAPALHKRKRCDCPQLNLDAAQQLPKACRPDPAGMHAMQEAADASHLLPAYDLRQVSGSLKDLRAQLARLKGLAQPRKGFSFLSKAPAGQQPAQTPGSLQQTPAAQATPGGTALPAQPAASHPDPSRCALHAASSVHAAGSAEPFPLKCPSWTAGCTA
jgi:hypothetical protein